MKKSNIIIAIVAILVVAGIGIGIYCAAKSDGDTTSTPRNYASNSTRSGSLLDRLNAEIASGAYKKKDNGGDAGQEETA